jgi:hypothetical protein
METGAMCSQPIQDELQEFFRAHVIFSTHSEKLIATRAEFVSVKSVDAHPVDCWKIRFFEDTINKATQTTEINLVQFFLEQNATSFDHSLAPVTPDSGVKKNTASFYKFEDSPDDEDAIVDAAYDFPLRKGWITYQWGQDKTTIRATFDLTLENPDKTTFQIMGSFNVKQGSTHDIAPKAE